VGRRRDLAHLTVTPPTLPSYVEQDPFDLPEWLGSAEVAWRSEGALGAGHRVAGTLTSAGHQAVPCDLLAVDDAYPEPVAADTLRVRAHQVWQHGEVLVVSAGGRVLLALPGSRVGLDDAVDALRRLAKAVGARPDAWSVLLRVGR
jgi:hypothetical protein